MSSRQRSVSMRSSPKNDGSRPGGNVTGWSNLLPQISTKLVGLLRELAPAAVRVAVLFDAGNPGKLLDLKAIQAAARTAGMTIRPMELRVQKDIDAAFATLAREPFDALIVLFDSVTSANRTEIVQHAARQRLLTVYQSRFFVEAGGLLSYGVNHVGQLTRTADYVARILNGEKPGNLPVEQPTQFELLVNLKAAKAQGIRMRRLRDVRSPSLTYHDVIGYGMDVPEYALELLLAYGGRQTARRFRQCPSGAASGSTPRQAKAGSRPLAPKRR